MISLPHPAFFPRRLLPPTLSTSLVAEGEVVVVVALLAMVPERLKRKLAVAMDNLFMPHQDHRLHLRPLHPCRSRLQEREDLPLDRALRLQTKPKTGASDTTLTFRQTSALILRLISSINPLSVVSNSATTASGLPQVATKPPKSILFQPENVFSLSFSSSSSSLFHHHRFIISQSRSALALALISTHSVFTDDSKSGDSYLRSVCFSPDGKYLACGAEDKTIKLWDIERNTTAATLQGHTMDIYSLDFSNDGRFIVSGSGDKKARIWSVDKKTVCLFFLSFFLSLSIRI